MSIEIVFQRGGSELNCAALEVRIEPDGKVTFHLAEIGVNYLHSLRYLDGEAIRGLKLCDGIGKPSVQDTLRFVETDCDGCDFFMHSFYDFGKCLLLIDVLLAEVRPQICLVNVYLVDFVLDQSDD